MYGSCTRVHCIRLISHDTKASKACAMERIRSAMVKRRLQSRVWPFTRDVISIRWMLAEYERKKSLRRLKPCAHQDVRWRAHLGSTYSSFTVNRIAHWTYMIYGAMLKP